MAKFGRNERSCVIFALRISEDVNNNISIRRHAVESLYRNLSVTSKYLSTDIVRSLLNIVRNPYKNEDEWEVFEMKRYAFSCLVKIANNISDKFYQNYYLYLKKQLTSRSILSLQQDENRDINDSSKKNVSANESEAAEIENLNVYLNTSNGREKHRILKTLSICISETFYTLDLSIFVTFLSHEWGKELLMYALLFNNDSWNVNQTSHLASEINELNIFLNEHNHCYCIEDVLEILICQQNTYKLDFEFLVKFVSYLRSNEALDVIFQDGCTIVSAFPKLELLWLKQKCDKVQIIYRDEKEIRKLRSQLVYSDEIIESTLSKVKPRTSITELIDFFNLLKNKNFNRNESFLRSLIPNETIESWKNKLSLLSIQNSIQKMFPAWDYETSVNVSDDTATAVNKLYFSPNSCNDPNNCITYHQFKESKKLELNEALSSDKDKQILNKLLNDLNDILMKLLSKNHFPAKTLDDITVLITSIDNENKIVQLINALELLDEYDVSISEPKVIDIISNSTEANVRNNVHQFILQQFMPGTYEKSIDQLIEELGELNKEGNISLLNSPILLKEEYQKVMDAYNKTVPMFEDNGLIKEWNRNAIKHWAKRHGVKNYLEPILSNVSENQYEKMAVLKRTIELTNGMTIRDVQLLSVILLLNNEKNTGRLAQINTGEGKTVIIAMLAAYHALQGRKVDVITSSKLLAVPQAKELEKFYDMLFLRVSHIFDSFSSYDCDVVYGTAHEFQADVLRDEFRRSGARRGRKFDIAIVDEVDNMLVDGKDHIVRLSCDMPAMNHLETLLAATYIQVQAAAESLVVKDGQCFFVDHENAFDENGQVKDEIVENHIPIACTKYDFIVEATKKHIKNLIRDAPNTESSSDIPEIKIPKHLRELICKTQLDKWIRAAISAKFYYRNKEDYIIINDQIKIVDAGNTGVVQMNMHWSDGLHQFVEIKHGARLTPEALPTNFISNVSFFRRYQPRIYGLSGTLGCQATRELLNKTYNVDTVVIPPFKQKQHKQLVPILVNNQKDWYNEIVKSCLRKLVNGRAVLIIMEYIRETEDVEKLFVEKFNYDKNKIKLYKTNDDSSVIEKPLENGNVIITTNIAGRGADIKLTEEVDRNGGLHVCITFLPKNSRVEQQNIGRTSRTGNRGTSQFIFWSQVNDIEQLQSNRYKREKCKLAEAAKEIALIMMRDELFQQFCQLMNDVQHRDEARKDVERQALEERFAIWLKIHNKEIEDKPKSDVLQMFEKFREKIMEDSRNGRLIENPYMHVKIGNIYLEKKRYSDAISEYTSAIQLDPDFAEHAHYNRGYAYLAKYGHDVSNNSYYIDQAVADFERARKLIKERTFNLHLMQTASNGEVFTQHVSSKLNLYNIQNSAINLAIGPDKQAIDQSIKDLEKKLQNDKLEAEIKEEISQKISELRDARNNTGVIKSARTNKRDIKIEIHRLKECLPEDDHTHDKAIKEFEMNGAIGSFHISEIPPIDWASVIGLLILGLGQLVLGAALTVFTMGAGASFGVSLIAEGISDIITAVKDGIINRDFSWSRWAVEKAISLTVSIICAGWSAMKDVGKTMYAGAKNAASFGSKVVSGSVKEGWKIAMKRVGFELSKGVTKNIMTELANYGISEEVIPLIHKEITERVRVPIVEALENNSFVKMMLQLDERNNNHYYENHIKAVGMKLLNSKSTFSKIFNPLNAWRDTSNKTSSNDTKYNFLDIAEKIGNRIADNKIQGLSSLRQALNVLEAGTELLTLTNFFINDLTKAIKKEAEKDKVEQKLTEPTVEVESEKQESTTGHSADKTEDDIDLNRLHEEDEQVMSTAAHGNARTISEGFVTVISANIVQIIQHKMISPIVQMGANYSVDLMTSGLAKSLNETQETYRSHRRVIYHQNKGFAGANAKTKKQRTDAETKQKIKKVEELIDSVRSGGESGLPHLGSASDAINRPIAVYSKDGKLQYIIGEEKKGDPVKIQYHEGKVGHYTSMGNEVPCTKSTDPNMCLYNAIASQTGDDPNKLKQSCIQIMETNKDLMAKQIDDINRLEMYSKLRLGLGGATYTGTCPDDAKKILDNSTDKKGHKIPTKGHPRKHASFKGTSRQKLEAVSNKLKQKIEIYDKDGKLQYVIGDKFKGKSIKLDHHQTPGDKSDEWFTSRGGKEKYRMGPSGDSTFYSIINEQAKCKASDLESFVSNEINRIPFKNGPKHCVENYSKHCVPDPETGKRTRGGFISDNEMDFVAHYALKTQKAQKAMQELNAAIKKNPNTSDLSDNRKVVFISKKQLNLPRKAYGNVWEEGSPTGAVREVETIAILLQHHVGKEKDPNADVHVHTIYPVYK